MCIRDRAGLEGLAFLAAGGGDGSGSDSANRLAGARGAAVQELLRRHCASEVGAKLLVACEQASRQDGKFTFAWTLTHLPEPPWGRLLRPGTPGPHNDFALLSDPGWVAAGLAYHRDAQALADLGRGNGGGRGAAGAGAAAKAGAKASAKAAPKRKGKNHKGSEAAAKASDS